MDITLSTYITLRSKGSEPTSHHFHTVAGEATPASLRGIHESLVAAGQMYVKFSEEACALTISGTPEEIKAWAHRLIGYVNLALADRATQCPEANVLAEPEAVASA